METIFQIIPALPPSINGLGDYALNLARQLRDDFAIDTCFIVADPNWLGGEDIEGFSVIKLPHRSRCALLNILQTNPYIYSKILLHYVGYGYARRGCPYWLINALQTWKKLTSERRLTTVFHEIYAPGHSPLTSSFWLSNLQKGLAAKLVKISDNIITNREENAGTLRRITRLSLLPVKVIPVFSNIGEARENIPLSDRRRRLVIFGHRNSRARIYQSHFSTLCKACQGFDIQEIYDIGIPTELELPNVNGIKIKETGILEPVNIMNILTDSIIGVQDFPTASQLGKSTVFAAFSASGVATIMTSNCSHSFDGLKANKHYLVDENLYDFLSLEKIQKISDNAYSWYQGHNLSLQAKYLSEYLNQR
jgi:hypothetical protein